MIDDSHLPLMENVFYTKYISVLAHSEGMLVEAELRRLLGTEDDLTVEDYETMLTNVVQGGITSLDLATKALEAKRAKVIGQALVGVSFWQLGPENRNLRVPYIVFPENGGYAIDAFNVYNLKGIEAVVAAAEAEKSPTILQNMIIYQHLR
ncbi:hypothetical protein J5N97_009574 [Dioscorea zingiberensis]|uniref:Uncharacterized protein n=1 Tax=Dioscorea zingiberensis TaxID=325984 RepID=A0A9D5HLS7_9LILI|nr:hypothetical protein J5N97_009574 [Dioscorea zingiberensis]